MLAPDDGLGRIWTLSRPLTYRAIDGLADKGLATAAQSSGASVALGATAAGHARRRVGWAPVQHLRDVRTATGQLTLRRRPASTTRSSSPPSGGLRRRSTGCLGGRRRRPSTSGAGKRSGLRRFLDQALPQSIRRRTDGRVRLSARNQLGHDHGRPARRSHVHDQGRARRRPALTAAITKEAARDLDLAPATTCSS
jgi:hypothetical protein